ncbi:MAG: S41 family peptidase, partial [Planctomycetota bacterium]
EPKTEKPLEEKAAPPEEEKPAEKEPEKEPEPLAIDFDRIHDRVRSISIRDVTESGLFWSPTGARLAFTATIDGRKGLYTVTFPDDLKPKLLTSTTGSGPRWVKEKKAIRWVVRGAPAVTTGPKTESYGFRVPQEIDVAARYGAAFDVAWRIMRDRFYDVRLNGRDWSAIRTKYRRHASLSPDRAIFGKVVSMMLGELNGSHLGFSVSPERREGYRDEWRKVTGALGVRWDPEFEGPGLRVLAVVEGGPADRAASRVVPGEVVTSIDGRPVDRNVDPARLLTVLPDRAVTLRVRPAEGEERTVVIRPSSLHGVRRLLYRQWVRDREAKVDEASGGRLGYLHVRGMMWGSFHEFERQLHAAGYGKDGLVIDVRDNGGGFTADHLLTALTQPRHAYTVQRGGAPGYPQDRKVYASWHKPIVVLINQSSFSNAEIFAHAIRTLGRGQVVGVATGGGVISTGGARVMDFGFIRTPGRGWFLVGDGEDLEQNGARPHHEVWPMPGDAAKGIDRQLDKAVEVLVSDVGEWKKTGDLPKPKYRSER